MNVKSHHTSEELRAFYRTEKNAKLAQRIHGVYLASKGLTCPEIMVTTTAARRTIQQWIHKYNEQSIDGLREKPRPGTPTKLPRKKEIKLKKRIESGPTKADGISVLNGPAIQRILEREFGVLYSKQGLYDLLHRLGYSCLCPRPQHENSNPQLQADFKKTSSRRWIQSNQSIQAKE